MGEAQPLRKKVHQDPDLRVQEEEPAPISGVVESDLEKLSKYEWHGYYTKIRETIRRLMPFTAKVFIAHKGLVTVTNEKTPLGGLTVILDEKHRAEPDENDMIFFDTKTIEDIGLDIRGLEKGPPVQADLEPEQKIPRISEEIKKRMRIEGLI